MRYNPFGGYERQAALVARSLIERGDEVHVFTHAWPSEEISGIEVHRVPMWKAASFLKVASFAFFVRRQLGPLRDRFDVVVGFDRTLDMDVYRAGNACHRAWLERRRSIDGVIKGAVNRLNPLHPVVNFLEKRIFLGSVDRVFAVLSEQSRRQIQDFYPVPESRFAILTPGVDIQRFHPGNRDRWRRETRNSLRVEEDRPLILHLGSGFRIKALDVSIRALALLPRPYEGTVLVVAGRGSVRPYLRLAEALRISERLRFVGPTKDPERLYAAADLFVLPTHFDTFGQTVLESMASGLPVLVSDAAGASDLVTAQGGGRVLASPVNPERMAEAVASLLSDEHELARLGREARGVAEGYTLEAGLEGLLGLLDKVNRERRR